MRKKFTYIAALACLSALGTHAQKQENVWIFGKGVGIDFNSGTANTIAAPAGRFNSSESAASVCDPVTGALLFYTCGDTAYNRNGSIMPNGIKLTGSFTHTLAKGNPTSSTAQGALIVPMPNHKDKYYIFSSTQLNYYGYSVIYPGVYKDMSGFVYYSIVDMSLDGGLGDVVSGQKGIPLDTTSNFTEHMIGVAGNNCNAWVILMDPQKATTGITRFKAFEVREDGVDTTPVISNVFTSNQSIIPIAQSIQQIVGRLAISPDRKKLAAAITSGDTKIRLSLYDFDPGAGLISNPLILDTSYTTKPKITYSSVCFSPDNSKLYTVSWSENTVYQFDISSNNANTIIGTRTSITTSFQFTDLKRGPDGKIYYFASGNSSAFNMGAINEPNKAGMACDPNPKALLFASSSVVGYGFPNPVPVITIPETLYAATDTSICALDALQVPLAGATQYTWDNGDTTATRQVDQPGSYWVSYTEDGCQHYVDTFHVQFIELNPVISVNGFELGTAISYVTYQWLLNGELINGATNPTYNVTENGDYQVIVTNEKGCVDTSAIYKVTNVGIQHPGIPSAQVKVYPNPAKDRIYILTPEAVDLQLSGVDGKIIFQAAQSRSMDIRDLATGIYLLQIRDQDGHLVKVEKVVKAD